MQKVWRGVGGKSAGGFCKSDGEVYSGGCAAGCNNHGQNLAGKEVRVAKK